MLETGAEMLEEDFDLWQIMVNQKKMLFAIEKIREHKGIAEDDSEFEEDDEAKIIDLDEEPGEDEEAPI